MYKPMGKSLGGIPNFIVILHISQNIDGFGQNNSQGFKNA